MPWRVLLRSLVSKAKEADSIVLFCHQNADPDAVCSAVGLQTILRNLAPGTKVEISCPGGVGASTKQLLENLGISVPGEKDRKSTRLNSSHIQKSRMPSSA